MPTHHEALSFLLVLGTLALTAPAARVDDPLPAPDGRPADQSEPVHVLILLGHSGRRGVHSPTSVGRVGEDTSAMDARAARSAHAGRDQERVLAHDPQAAMAARQHAFAAQLRESPAIALAADAVLPLEIAVDRADAIGELGARRVGDVPSARRLRQSLNVDLAALLTRQTRATPKVLLTEESASRSSLRPPVPGGRQVSRL